MPNPQYLQQARKVQMYYDPRGQVVKTVNPDGSQQQVLFGMGKIEWFNLTEWFKNVVPEWFDWSLNE